MFIHFHEWILGEHWFILVQYKAQRLKLALLVLSEVVNDTKTWHMLENVNFFEM
jgi:hypothetical protein